VAGRPALLLPGFGYPSRFAVDAWARRFRRQFKQEPGVTFYQVPVYGGADAWKRSVGFRDPDAAYLILLDAEGHVAWLHAGPFDEGAYRELSSEVLNLCASVAR
jgi:hypothetical protein